ncbi:hypothetical protein L3Q90_002514 [Salmonella enterica subsp. enterica serovar Enteritidis]|nr:hypothetical protein [Salmonella enterica subsp. enterica serovar Enteritidis]
MQIVIDFALSESRRQLDEILLGLKRDVEFELHDALAVHENRLSVEIGSGVDVAICDTGDMVNQLIERMFTRLRNILNYPHRFELVEGTDQITDLLSEAFDKVGESLAGLHQENLGETYVAVVINGQSSNVTDTVTWSDIVDQPIIDKITKLYRDAEMKVLAICRRELLYLGEKYGKPAE